MVHFLSLHWNLGRVAILTVILFLFVILTWNAILIGGCSEGGSPAEFFNVVASVISISLLTWNLMVW